MTGVLSDLGISVFCNDELLVQNDDWGTSALTAFTEVKGELVGAFPLGENSHDTAVVFTLRLGAYTGVVMG